MHYQKPSAIENLYWDFVNNPEKREKSAKHRSLFYSVLSALNKSYADYCADKVAIEGAIKQHANRSRRHYATYDGQDPDKVKGYITMPMQYQVSGNGSRVSARIA
jgi:hypothetical protein